MPSVAVCCEYSGTVRDAFAARGFDAWSCDLLDSETPGQHVKGDAIEFLYSRPWDLVVAHPPCQYLTNAANRWLTEDSAVCTALERIERRDQALAFFREFVDYKRAPTAIENPLPHTWLLERVGRYQDFVRPNLFGDTETKGICLWLYDLPPLMSTIIETRTDSKIHTMSPGPDRAKERARFFPGVAAAMADQWGAAIRAHDSAGIDEPERLRY